LTPGKIYDIKNRPCKTTFGLLVGVLSKKTEIGIAPNLFSVKGNILIIYDILENIAQGNIKES